MPPPLATGTAELKMPAGGGHDGGFGPKQGAIVAVDVGAVAAVAAAGAAVYGEVAGVASAAAGAAAAAAIAAAELLKLAAFCAAAAAVAMYTSICCARRSEARGNT
jgi:hypothetical protein